MKSILEIWKWIPGYEGLYKVSNTGLVKSFYKQKRILKAATDRGGYLRVVLSKEGKLKNKMVHRLVAETFISNPNKLPQINHKDEDKTNNWLTNLEWCTSKYNNNYGTAKLRSAYTRSQTDKRRKTVYQYTLDGQFIREWDSAREVQRVLGLNQSHIGKCCNGIYKQYHGFKWSYVFDLQCTSTSQS